MSGLLTWLGQLMAPDDDDKAAAIEIEKQKQRIHIIESITPNALAQQYTPSYFGMVVDKEEWDKTAGPYGTENTPLNAFRMVSVETQLNIRSISKELVRSHRTKYLDDQNKPTAQYATKLRNDHQLLVVFRATDEEQETKCVTRPFYKNRRVYAVFSIARDTESGSFCLPTNEQIAEQFNKTKL